MPLVVVSGFPASGKTHRANQLLSFFESKISAAQALSAESDATNDKTARERISRLRVHHVSDDTLGLARSVYATAREEKNARAAFYSSVKRNLTRDNIVIADSLNYIKGYRYQLHCEAKEARTPSCVVHVGTPITKCRDVNAKRLSEEAADAYNEELFENLIFRYEEPNGMNRWDSPLFTVVQDDEHPPYNEIWDALFAADGKGKAIRPNAATVLAPPTQQNALYELDRQTTDIVSRIQTWQQDHPDEVGGEIEILEVEEPVRLPAGLTSGPITAAQLQRLRRQFIHLNRQHQLEKGRVRHLFVDYLNDVFERT